MSENNDFIQLPPIKKDTPSEVVSMIWQYLKLPEESRKRVKAELINVYVQKYEKHKTLDEMLQEWQGAGQFIIVMDTWFEKLMAE